MASHLTDYLLSRGHKVIAIDNLEAGKQENINPKANFVNVDLKNRKAVAKLISAEKPEVIYHLAAHACEGQSVFNPIYTFESNVMGFLNLLVPAINVGLKTFVFTSSMAVYGRGDRFSVRYGFKPFTEDMPRLPVDPYGVTKASIERLLEIYSKDFDFNYVIFRPHNVYGPRQSLTNPYRNVLGVWMNRIMHGKPPIIYGDGRQTRAFSYIDDCTPVIAESAWNKKAYGEIFNIGGDEVTTLLKACVMVMVAMDYSGDEIYAPERLMEVRHAFCNQSKAKEVLGFKAETPLKVGIPIMAEWALQQGPQPFDWWDKFEISRKPFKVWSEKQL